MDSCLNFPDKCEDHFSFSSEDFSACKTYLIYKMRGGPQGRSTDWVHEGVHGPGPQWRSMDLGPGVHVLYTSVYESYTKCVVE